MARNLTINVEVINGQAKAGLAEVEKGIKGVTGASATSDDRMKILSDSLQKIGSKATAAGSALSAGVTLPLVAAATASLTFSTQFETSMTQVETLSGVSAKNVGQMRQEILALAPAVGIGPQALAEALLVVTSTGLRGAEAMQILEQAAKASTAGLGDAKDIARAMTSAITAYGKENLTAANAANKLFVAVREGGAEASEFAGVLGRVVGLAATMGVSFDEVTASVATFTRLGVDADEAVTALRGTLSNFLHPAQQVTDVLQSIGLSADDVRKSIRERGLSVTLNDLVERLHGNEAAIGTLIPNVRALAGVLGTSGAQGAAYSEVLGKIKGSTNELDTAFQRASETGGVKWNQFLANAQVVLIQFGDALAPVFQKVLSVAGTFITNVLVPMVNGFAALPAPVQTAIIVLGALAAALGPVLLIVGQFAMGIGALIALWPMLVTAFSAILPFLGPVGLIAAGVAAVLVVWYKWDAIVDLAARVYAGVKEWLVDKFGAVVNWIGEKVGMVTGFFKDMYDKVIGHSYVPDMITGIQSEMAKLETVFVQPAQAANAAVLETFRSTTTAVVSTWSGAMDLVRQGLGTMSGTVSGPSAGTPGGTTRYDDYGNPYTYVPGTNQPGHASPIPHFAAGVTGFSGGAALVGERGPELVQLPKGSNVVPNSALGRSSVTVNIDARESFFDSAAGVQRLADKVANAIVRQRLGYGAGMP